MLHLFELCQNVLLVLYDFKVSEVVCGSSWLSARPSTSLMLADVRALRGRPLPLSVDTAGHVNFLK